MCLQCAEPAMLGTGCLTTSMAVPCSGLASRVPTPRIHLMHVPSHCMGSSPGGHAAVSGWATGAKLLNVLSADVATQVASKVA